MLSKRPLPDLVDKRVAAFERRENDFTRSRDKLLEPVDMAAYEEVGGKMRARRSRRVPVQMRTAIAAKMTRMARSKPLVGSLACVLSSAVKQWSLVVPKKGASKEL